MVTLPPSPQVGIWLNLEQFSLLSMKQFLLGGAVVLLGFSLGAGLALLFRRPIPQVSPTRPSPAQFGADR